MKGCILSAIYAIEALLAMNYRAFGEIRFLCVSDEEINIRHCQDVLQTACENAKGALVLEAARSNGDIVSARKGHTWYKLTALGRAAHAGVEPQRGRNAILELSFQVQKMQALNGTIPGATLSVGIIRGGERRTTEAADEGVTGTGRQAEPPGDQVPDDRAEQCADDDP